MHGHQRNVHQSRTSTGFAAFVLPWLAVCGIDLHGHRINKTLLCDTMAMIRLPWLAIAQHVFPPAFHRQARLAQSRFCGILSPASRIKGIRGEQISRKTVSRERGPRNYRVFAKNHTLGRHVCEMGGQKMGSNMRPRYVRFRDIHDRDILGLHCNMPA